MNISSYEYLLLKENMLQKKRRLDSIQNAINKQCLQVFRLAQFL
jgi:hypothetical protein